MAKTNFRKLYFGFCFFSENILEEGGLLRLFLIASSLVLFPFFSKGALLDTGSVLSVGQKRAFFSYELTKHEESFGSSFLAHLDSSLGRESQVRGVFGVGVGNFQVGFFHKWIPFPDYEHQPAMGLSYGFVLVRKVSEQEKVNDIRFHVNPLASKIFHLNSTDLETYIAFPSGVRFHSPGLDYFVQAAGGVSLKNNYFHIPFASQSKFWLEVGINIKNSSSHLAVGMSAILDSSSAESIF